MYDPLADLRGAGCPVDQLSPSQRDVLASLTKAEATVLISVLNRLQAVEPDVVAHEMKLL